MEALVWVNLFIAHYFVAGGRDSYVYHLTYRRPLTGGRKALPLAIIGNNEKITCIFELWHHLKTFVHIKLTLLGFLGPPSLIGLLSSVYIFEIPVVKMITRESKCWDKSTSRLAEFRDNSWIILQDAGDIFMLTKVLCNTGHEQINYLKISNKYLRRNGVTGETAAKRGKPRREDRIDLGRQEGIWEFGECNEFCWMLVFLWEKVCIKLQQVNNKELTRVPLGFPAQLGECLNTSAPPSPTLELHPAVQLGAYGKRRSKVR